MSDAMIVIEQANDLVAVGRSFDGLINGWLDEKSKITGSNRTPEIYSSTLESFRASLLSAGLDLDSPSRDIRAAAQAWAGTRSANSRRAGPVSGSTIKQRLAVLSSFYEYAIRAAEWEITNPIDRVKRPKVQAYGDSRAIDQGDITNRLRQIDRSLWGGMRDYALLSVALTTGRRLSAISGLRWRDLHTSGGIVTLTFREKGGKVMRDELAPNVGRALMNWLYEFYGSRLGDLAPDAPVWVSLDNRTRGAAMGIQGVAAVAEKHLGTSKFHALRHTFARRMDKRGAKLTEIQARLGHQDAKTTSIYLSQLDSATNEHAAGLADDFGIE